MYGSSTPCGKMIPVSEAKLGFRGFQPSILPCAWAPLNPWPCVPDGGPLKVGATPPGPNWAPPTGTQLLGKVPPLEQFVGPYTTLFTSPPTKLLTLLNE